MGQAPCTKGREGGRNQDRRCILAATPILGSSSPSQERSSLLGTRRGRSPYSQPPAAGQAPPNTPAPTSSLTFLTNSSLTDSTHAPAQGSSLPWPFGGQSRRVWYKDPGAKPLGCKIQLQEDGAGVLFLALLLSTTQNPGHLKENEQQMMPQVAGEAGW